MLGGVRPGGKARAGSTHRGQDGRLGWGAHPTVRGQGGEQGPAGETQKECPERLENPN